MYTSYNSLCLISTDSMGSAGPRRVLFNLTLKAAREQ